MGTTKTPLEIAREEDALEAELGYHVPPADEGEEQKLGWLVNASAVRFRRRFRRRLSFCALGNFGIIISRESEREDEEKKNNVTRIFQILLKIIRRSCPKRLFRIIITRRFLSLTPERRVHKTLRSHCSLCFSPSSSIASFLTRSKKRESMMPSSRSNEDARHKVSRSLSLCL